MTLAEKLALPAGPELDRVIAEELLGWTRNIYGEWDTHEKWPDGSTKKMTHQLAYSTRDEPGWKTFYEWLRGHDLGASFIPRENMTVANILELVRPSKGTQSPIAPIGIANGELLAAWRAALAWNDARKETT